MHAHHDDPHYGHGLGSSYADYDDHHYDFDSWHKEHPHPHDVHGPHVTHHEGWHDEFEHYGDEFDHHDPHGAGLFEYQYHGYEPELYEGGHFEHGPHIEAGPIHHGESPFYEHGLVWD